MNTKREVYLDNAATSKYKPPGVIEAMSSFLKECACNPGRGGYSCSLDAGRVVYQTRLMLADFFNTPAPEQVIFTYNVTYALNFIIKGLIKQGDHVITSSMEHNSVLRPLKYLQDKGIIDVDYLPCEKKGFLSISKIKNAIRENTKALILTHASNVTGTLMPIKKAAELAADSNLIFILDTAQTAGSYKIDFVEMGMDILCFTGHKGLLGPTGTGGFIIKKEIAERLDPVFAGGTGSSSHLLKQPSSLPDKFEYGTLNTAGLAGLKAGIEFIRKKGLDRIYNHKKKLTAHLLDGLKAIKGITIYGPADPELQTSTISITIEGFDLSNVSHQLDLKYGIMTRSGLHCAPLAHKTIGTYPRGTLRFSPGYFNTLDEVDYTLKALKEIIL